MPIMDSIALVERSVRARVGGTSRASTVRVSASPSRRLAAAEGWVLSSSQASAGQLRLGLQRRTGVVGGPHPPLDTGAHPPRQMVFHVADLVQLAPADHRVADRISATIKEKAPRRATFMPSREATTGP